MGDTATITISQNSDGSYKADVNPERITADSSKNVNIEISSESPGWMFDGVTQAPQKATGWKNVGSGVFIENGDDFTVKSDSTSREVKLKDTGKDKGSHPEHHYLCCLTNGTDTIDTDPIIIDKNG